METLKYKTIKYLLQNNLHDKKCRCYLKKLMLQKDLQKRRFKVFFEHPNRVWCDFETSIYSCNLSLRKILQLYENSLRGYQTSFKGRTLLKCRIKVKNYIRFFKDFECPCYSCVRMK